VGTVRPDQGIGVLVRRNRSDSRDDRARGRPPEIPGRNWWGHGRSHGLLDQRHPSCWFSAWLC